MKKSAIFLAVLLLASIAGTYAVYELYVKDRMRDLAEHKRQRDELAKRIQVLEDTFLKTSPQVVLDKWRESTQPWSEAVDTRAQFFTLGDLIPEVEIPEEILPKIFYREEIPKRIKKLEDYAADRQVALADRDCGAPGADSFGQGTNPKPEEIAEILESFDYCAALTTMMIDARPVALQPLRIWPEEGIEVKSGKIVIRTTGVTMQLRMQDFARFLDNLSQSDRYFRIEELKLSNTDLTQADPVLNAEFILSQAYFVAATKGATTAKSATKSNKRINSVFGNPQDILKVQAEPTFWERVRGWLPF